jgi:hypothetical protein
MTKNYVYAWDLDETIGNFLELGMFWDALNKYYNYTLTETDFHNILDIYPKFFRPNIFNTFKGFKKIKQRYPHVKVMIYTNNQGPDSWALWISHYIENQIGYKLFDQIIKAYKIGNMEVEKCRTSHQKNMPDLLNCTDLSSNTEVCFFDDQPHEEMRNHPNVNYISLDPYIYSMPFDKMINLFISSYNKNQPIDNVYKFNYNIKKSLLKYNHRQKIKTNKQYQNDIKMTAYIKKSIFQFASKFRNRKKSPFSKGWNKIRTDTPYPRGGTSKTRRSHTSHRFKSIKKR